MGLYAIDCPSCSKPFMWFSGNQDQRCEACQKPREWWLPIIYQEDSPEERAESCGLGVGSDPYVLVIEKSAYDFQCKQVETMVKQYNQLLDRYNLLLDTTVKK